MSLEFNPWAAFLGNPLFLVKARMQAYSPSFPVGTQRYYKSGFDALRSIYSTDGFGGLFRGAGAAMFRTSLGTSVQMPTYFFAKRKIAERGLLREDNPVTVVLSSAAAGAMVVSIGTAYRLQGLTFYPVLVYVASGHYSHKTVRIA
jgi:solute carrier family 25, member 34/35